MDDLLNNLISKGKKQGYLTLQDVKDELPETTSSDPDSLDFFADLLEKMNIKVVRSND